MRTGAGNNRTTGARGLNDPTALDQHDHRHPDDTGSKLHGIRPWNSSHQEQRRKIRRQPRWTQPRNITRYLYIPRVSMYRPVQDRPFSADPTPRIENRWARAPAE